MSWARALRHVRHLKPEQWQAQLRHMLGPRPTPPARDDSGVGEAAWAIDRLAAAPPPAPAHARWDGAGRLELVGREVDFGSLDAIDWSHDAAGPLWAYQLHFFEWARSREVSAEARERVLAAWLAAPRRGPGWDPHPISVRVLSWLKMRFAGELPDGFAGSARDARLRASLATQVAFLSQHVERRLQANHLLENWIAVVAAGLALDAPGADAWIAGVDPLCAELREQVGADGAHYERSPMYHAVLLEHLLDLLSIARRAGSRAPAGLEGVLEDTCGRMTTALSTWCHPDGEIALLGDSALGIAQSPAVLGRYAHALGIVLAASREPGLLRSSGHARLQTGALCWIGSLAGPSPPYQPGHAHCDALAFELSVGSQRVVTDTGVYEYVEGARRRHCRSTRAHATFEVGACEQAEVWSSHRVGGRPRVELLQWEPGRAVEASCAGWQTPATTHRRRIEIAGDDLLVRDWIEGKPEAVRASLPLAPGLEPVLEAGGARARVPLARDRVLWIDLPASLAWHVERAPYYPRFGQEIERAVLVGVADRFDSDATRFRVERSEP